MQKLISVIIPCYNAQETISRCADSLLRQTIGLQNMELIFVDDASTDQTLSYLFSLEQKYPDTITIISCPQNQKQGMARNIGMSHASGKYLGFVDADDWILPQMYEEMVRCAEATGSEQACPFTLMIAADRNFLYPALVLLTSVFHHHRNIPVTVYFLQTGLTKEDIENIRRLAKRWPDKTVHCISVTPDHIGGLQAFGRFSVAAFFRILGMKLLPDTVRRVLYLDVDMVINRNISELFQMEMTAPIAACYDINNALQGNIDYHKAALGIPSDYGYFNSGMLLLDLDYMRKHNMSDEILADIASHSSEYQLVDQDALNKKFFRVVQWLPWNLYNCPAVLYLSQSEKWDGDDTALIPYQTILQCAENGTTSKGYDVTPELASQAAILHYCTQYKPWRDPDAFQSDSRRQMLKYYQRYEKILKMRDF